MGAFDPATAVLADAAPSAPSANRPPGRGSAFDPTTATLLEGSAPPAAASASPVGDMNTAQRFLAAFGKQLSDWNRGAKQLNAGDAVNPETGEVLDQSARRAELDAEEQETRRLDAPLMRTTAGKVGAMAASAVPFVVAPEGYLPAAAVGATEGLLTPTQEGESRVANTALGGGAGAAGTAVGRLAGRLIRPIGNYLTADRQAATDTLLRVGVPLDAAQQTGSRILITAKNAAADSPLQGPSELPARQADAFTRAVLRTVGVDGDSASQPTMSALRQTLRDNYNGVAQRYAIKFDPADGYDPLTRDLQDVLQTVDTSLTREDAAVIRKQVQNVTDAGKQGQVINGARYQAINQALDRVPGEGGKAPFVADIRTALTAALKRAASPEDQALLAQTDARYAAMKQIQAAIDSNKVRPDLLYNAMDTQARAGQSVYGDGPNQQLFRLAEAGRMVLGRLAQTPNSGTTQRAAGMALFGTLGGLADNKVRGGDGFETSLAALAGAAFGPAALRAVIENPRAAAAIAGWARSKGINTAADVARWIASRGASGAAVEQGTYTPPPAQN
jgi:hypothetical protein